jgi:aldose 1-epimerase
MPVGVLTPDNARLTVVQRPFGSLPDGRVVQNYVLCGDTLELHLTEFGAIISALWTPDANGQWGNVVLGYPSLDPYLTNPAYLGAVVGRHANRIADGRLWLDGEAYQLTPNEGPHHLHGGPQGFHRQLWRSAIINASPDSVGVAFSRISPAGEEGYPGTVHATVRYLLDTAGDLSISYEATTDAPTVVSMTQHSYFNLAGSSAVSALDQELTIAAEAFTPVTPALLPTGERAPVAGTPFDFRRPRSIRDALTVAHPQLETAGGFDHNWVLRGTPDDQPVVVLRSPVSGRRLEIWSDAPGLQFYDGHFLDLDAGRGGFPRHAGICLETQYFPDGPNHPNFPSPRLAVGDVYASTTRWRFTAS